MTTATRNPFVMPAIEHLATVRDLEAYLAQELAHATDPAERKRLETACSEAYSCDPWKYEPVLLDRLIALRQADGDQEDIDRLRGLIRAGSWMQYQRHDDAAVLEDIRRLRRAEPERGDALQEAARLYADKVVGVELEWAAQLIEDLDLRAWLNLKKLAHAHGQGTDADTVHQRLLRQEIEDLRAVRDAFYFRRLYPTISMKGF